VPDASRRRHNLAQLEQAIRTAGASVFLKDVAFRSIPQVLARGHRHFHYHGAPSVGAMPQSTDVWSHFELIVGELLRIAAVRDKVNLKAARKGT